MKAKYLIVPDVHGRTYWREPVKSVLQQDNDTKVIFLGDYLDPYSYEGVTCDDAIEVFSDILNIKKNYPERVILLVGNHDYHYIDGSRSGCRMDYVNKEKISSMFKDNIDLFDVCHFDTVCGKNIIFSHAGFLNGWIWDRMNDILPRSSSEALPNDSVFGFLKGVRWNEFLREGNKMFNDCSSFRGGDDDNSSPMWADVIEMIFGKATMFGKEMVDTVQVFGHSQQDSDPVNYNDTLYCLDCRRVFYIDENGNVLSDEFANVPENGTDIKKGYEDRLRKMMSFF